MVFLGDVCFYTVSAYFSGNYFQIDIQHKYTADDIVNLLSHIEELKECSIFILRHKEGKVTFVVGNSAYRIVQDEY